MGLTRRTFSALAGTAALGSTLVASKGTATRAVSSGAVPTGPAPGAPIADRQAHTVALDRYSLLVDGRRLVLWSGEMHPFRLPSPSLWRDVLQKMRAHGYNAVSAPVAWNHHSPAPGSYDFTGVRDLGLFLRMAAETGLYVVLRPGPYIGAEVDGGGFPGWLTAVGGRARTADPVYLRYADEWLTEVDAIAAGHQFTRGTGTVLLYEIESGDQEEGGGEGEYLSHLRRKVRSDGIDVPVVSGRGADAGSGRRAYLTRLAEGESLGHVSLAFGGTSWGWLPAPGGSTSYDRGAGIDEGRNATAKLAPTHQIGQLLSRQRDFARLRPGRSVRATDPRLRVDHLTNPDTGAHLYVLRNDGEEPVSTTLPGTDVEAPVTVPGGDARVLATGLALGRRKLRFASVQPMMCVTVGRQDIAVFTGPRGELARVVLDCPEEPTTTRVDAEGAWVYDRGLLRVNAPLGAGGLIRVKVEAGGEARPLLLCFADDETSLRLWPYDTPSGTLLVYGPALLREVALRDGTAQLTGDTIEQTGLEVWAPRGIDQVTWNGRPVDTRPSGTGSLVARRMLPGVPPVRLPTLEGGWRRRTENPESAPDFDDSAWRTADRTTSHSVTPVPEGQPVLFADDYGFHYGDVWYRGRFARDTGEGGDAGAVESVSLAYRTDARGLLMAWLDGEPLGTHRMPVPDVPANGTEQQAGWAAQATFPLPDGPAAGRADTRVLSVLVRPMPHPLDGGARDSHRTARGLTGVTFKGAPVKVSWRLQGVAVADPVRGPLNNGGLFGEREGWHLPGFADTGWEAARLPRSDERRQGVTWYRRTFRLGVAPGTDASVGLVLDDDPARAYRVQIFLNGWNMGQYVNDLGRYVDDTGQYVDDTGRYADDAGPQHTFALPNGVLRTRGTNTLALAVLSEGTTGAGPREVRLTLLGAAAGGVTVKEWDAGRPTPA